MGNSKKIFRGIDWPLLLFLLGLTYVKLYVKLIAIVLYAVYVLLKKYPLPKINRLQVFYLLLIIVAISTGFVNNSLHHTDYRFGFVIGLVQWGLALFASYLIFISVKVKSNVELLQLIKAFFVINAMISIATLLYIIVDTGFRFPYWLSTSKYGVSTGDYIRGVFSDSSIANAAICAMGSIYFIRYKLLKWALLCAFIMMLCTSNITLLVFLLILVIQPLLSKVVNRGQTVKVFLFVLFVYPLLSIQNLSYISLIFKREAKSDYTVDLERLDVQEQKVSYSLFKKRKKSAYNDVIKGLRIGSMSALIKTNSYHALPVTAIKPVFNKKEFYFNIDKYRAALKNPRVSLAGEVWGVKNGDKKYYKKGYALDPELVALGISGWYADDKVKEQLDKASMPGKLYTHLQTLYFIRSNPQYLLLGAGLGNFSSKLAIKMTGLELQGSYPEDKMYIALPFLQYHFYTLLHYLSHHVAEHSVMNMPNSVYNQLLGEYGLVGVILFIVFYLGFFLSKRKKIRHLIPLLLLLLLLFEVEYWFEVLSLTIIFELMVFSEIYAKKEHE